MHSVYLDYNATTPLRPEALAAMLPYLQGDFGNPSSVHWAGRRAKQGLEDARERVAAFLHARPAEILFTSGGTESNNLALRGVIAAARGESVHVITTAIEHSSTLEPLRLLASEGVAITTLPVDNEGKVNVDDVRAAVRPDTVLVSIGLANHEIGTIQPIAEFSQVTRGHGVILHVDAVQAAGKLPLDVNRLGADLLSLSAHKIYGPKGIGALYVRKGVSLAPLMAGGAQEREKRPGTENVAAAVGFGCAATLAAQELELTASHCLQLIYRLWEGIQARVPAVTLNGSERHRLANTLNVWFMETAGEGLLMGLDLAGIAVSTGSACAAGSIEPSHVLLALGRPEAAAKSALRFSVGKYTTEQEIDHVLEVLPGIVARVRRAARQNNNKS
jgi:cysteine desulfurase